LGSNASTGNEVSHFEGIDDKTLLQVNGSMVVGTLFVLTLTALIPNLQVLGMTALGLITMTIILPFVISAILVLSGHKLLGKERVIRWAKSGTKWGFIIFVLYLANLLAFSIGGAVETLENLEENVELRCAASPETFNVTAEPWKCSMFTPGSLAEQCARNPENFDVECSQFIPPSS
jgi:hypothetical protein